MSWLWALLLVLGVLALALAALPWALSGWIDRALRAELASRGIHTVHIGEIRVGLGETVVEGLVLGEAELVAPRIRAEYALDDLLRGRVALLKLEGIRATGRLGGDASAGVLETLAEGTFGAPDAGAAPLFRGLEISDLRLALQTPAAEIAVAIEGRLDHPDARWIGELRAGIQSEPDRVRGTARLSARPEEQGIDLALEGEALEFGGVSLESFAVSLDGRLTDGRADGTVQLDASAQTALGPATLSLPGQLRIDLAARHLALLAAEPQRSRLVLPAQDLELSGISGEIALDGESPQARIQVARLRDLHDPARVAPLALDANLSWQAAELRGSGTLTGARQGLVVRFDATHDLAAAKGRVRLKLTPVEFAAKGLQPHDLSQLLARLQATRGRFDAEWLLSWGDAPSRSDLSVGLRDLTGRWEDVPFEGLDTKLRLTRPWPPAAAPGQTLEVARAELGLDLEQVAVRFGLQPPGVLDVASARARLLGGTLETRGRFDPALQRNDFVLDVSGVDAAALAEKLRIEGLSVSGSLSGRVPVAVREGAVFIENGELAATGDGVLRYRPDPGAPLPTADASVRLLLDALRDFHYEQLRITLTGALSGQLKIGVHLAGSSPDFYEGHATEFNLDLEAPVAALLRDLEVDTLPERILQGIRERRVPEGRGTP